MFSGSGSLPQNLYINKLGLYVKCCGHGKNGIKYEVVATLCCHLVF